MADTRVRIAAEVVMGETGQADALTWVARQLSWERRLRELEGAVETDDAEFGQALEPVSEPARTPRRPRRAGSRAPAH